jgi:hypothetical protein
MTLIRRNRDNVVHGCYDRSNEQISFSLALVINPRLSMPLHAMVLAGSATHINLQLKDDYED